jgi:2-succinyl-5-enolpyruvyl-6-hydroxy-3-cyclohexene-1-carboxylate synthase
MYQWNYYTASNGITLEEGLKQVWESNDQPTILEVFTPTRENDQQLLNYFKALV